MYFKPPPNLNEEKIPIINVKTKVKNQKAK